MDNKKKHSTIICREKDKEAIKKILMEIESDEVARERLHRIVYEASPDDEFTIDTDLIKESVQALDERERTVTSLSVEKKDEMLRQIERQYKQEQKFQWD